ncbi:phosphatidylinositol 4-kinase [Vigna unguiculata]|uniref:Phosphatidylinositol 4-kinase n=1 Tax=Vigna unguiculata TaxID=3917 RepID=A0A4D6KVV3_VIGUN|nr:phosphatidylinositol 4-kinase [Vigna unguiculata]
MASQQQHLIQLHFDDNASTFVHSYGQSFFLLLLFFAVLIFVPSLFFCIHLCRRCFSRHGRSTATTVVSPLPDLQCVGIELTNNIMVGFEKEECCICLSLFQGNEKLKVLIQCEHVFHSHCLDLWLTTHPSCPLCRASLHLRQNLTK